MFKNIKPVFEAGNILKIEMLEELRDYTRDYLDILYKDYTDGIIKGCTITIDDSNIYVSDGIIKYNNKIYMLKGIEKFSYVSNNIYIMLKVRFKEAIEKDGFIIHSSELVLDENLNLAVNEMEICRFKLREGARLRNEHIDFTDLSTEFDTVNIIHSIYAGRGESTIAPIITRYFGRELFNTNLENPLDISFALMCMQNTEPISREVIMDYIRSKIDIADRYFSNMEIYNYLLQILNTAKNGGDSRGSSRGRHRKILLD